MLGGDAKDGFADIGEFLRDIGEVLQAVFHVRIEASGDLRHDEHGQAWSQLLNGEQAHRNIRLDGGQEKQQNQWKTDAEGQVPGASEEFFAVARSEGQESHALAFELVASATKASSNVLAPVLAISSAAIPSAFSLPRAITPMRFSQDALAEDHCVIAGRFCQARQHLDRRSLARPVDAEQSKACILSPSGQLSFSCFCIMDGMRWSAC